MQERKGPFPLQLASRESQPFWASGPQQMHHVTEIPSSRFAIRIIIQS